LIEGKQKLFGENGANGNVDIGFSKSESNTVEKTIN